MSRQDIRTSARMAGNHVFTGATIVAAILLVTALIFLLSPMLTKGLSAVIFRQTVEFKRMELELFGRGDPREVASELQQTEQVRQNVYALLDGYSAGTELKKNIDLAKDNYRVTRRHLRDLIDNGKMEADHGRQLQRTAKQIRDLLREAFEEEDNLDHATSLLDEAIALCSEEEIAQLDQQRQITLARNYRKNIAGTTAQALSKRREQLPQLRLLLKELLGPRPGSPVPPLPQNRYGATRWDMASKTIDQLLWVTEWVPGNAGEALTKSRVSRIEMFAGTDIEQMLIMVRDDSEKMLRPEMRIYWRYFIDDSTPGHYFGGVGPEILGTLLITLLTMVPALPLGIGAGAYLAGRKRGGIVGILRICIDTLAGVPSIVFGLFGLTFFIRWLQPALGLPTSAGILAGSLTLSILVLPVIIRASEEAIRSVPRGYTEGSLALGAGNARTFWLITLPAALPGVLTGVILSLGRAAGETAPVLLTAAAAMAAIPKGLFEPTRILSFGAYDIAVGDRLSALVPHNQYGMVMTLVLLVLGLSTSAILLRRRISRKLSGR